MDELNNKLDRIELQLAKLFTERDRLIQSNKDTGQLDDKIDSLEVAYNNLEQQLGRLSA